MPQSEPDLAHTLETVAELLPICLTTWESRGKGIRVLRLVSKRVGSVALQAVQSCALQVGIGAQPEPEHVVQLMRDAHLKNLEVTVLITSGVTAPSSEQQLAACISQTHCIIDTLHTAMKWATSLQVSMHHRCHDDTHRLRSSGPLTEFTVWTPIPSMFCNVAHTTYCLLAEALPCLEKLSVGEDFGNSAISAFGPACSRLCRLEVKVAAAYEARHATPLKDLSIHLPHLTHLTLRGGVSGGFEYGFYLSKALAHVQSCAELICLEVDFGGGMLALHSSQTWDLAPVSLQEFNCSSRLSYPRMSLGLCSRLVRLTVFNLHGQLLSEFLQTRPLLQQLTVLGPVSVELLCDRREYTKQDNLSLRKRFDSGLQMRCRHVGLSGLREEIRVMLTWLPPLLSVSKCTVRLYEDSDGVVLHELERVFPNMSKLNLIKAGPPDVAYQHSIGMQALLVLSGCKSLVVLNVGMCVRSLTTQLGLELCKGLPALKVLNYDKYSKKDCLQLESDLSLLGREIQFGQYQYKSPDNTDDSDG